MPKKLTKKPTKKVEKVVEEQDDFALPGDEIKYELEAKFYTSESEHGPITAKIAEEWLGWYSQSANIAAGKEAKPDASPKEIEDEFSFKNPLLTDMFDDPIMCFNNTKNRPFRVSGAKAYAQDILKRRWAGPHNKEYFQSNLSESDDTSVTVNGEPIIIGRYGNVESGQHRLIGLKLAAQMWNKNPELYEGVWDEEPFLESLVVFGVSENPRVLQTHDNVIPRTLADTLFTSGIYKDRKPVEKKELSRMLAKAVELLWTRVGINHPKSGRKLYKTHSEENEFLERHPKLLECIEHIHHCDRTRGISAVLKLDSGHCSALLYLMAAGQTDPDIYHDGEASTWSEDNVDFSLWEKATEFWNLVSKNEIHGQVPLNNALGMLTEIGEGSARNSEKYVIIARAWMDYLSDKDKDDPILDTKNFALTEKDYVLDKNKKLVLDKESWTDFGGIDYGDPAVDGIKPYEEEDEKEDAKNIKERKRLDQAKRLQNLLDNKNGTPKDQAETLIAELEKLKEEHEGKILMFHRSKEYRVFAEDADIFQEVLKCKPKDHMGVRSCTIKMSSLKSATEKLVDAGYEFHIIAE